MSKLSVKIAGIERMAAFAIGAMIPAKPNSPIIAVAARIRRTSTTPCIAPTFRAPYGRHIAYGTPSTRRAAGTHADSLSRVNASTQRLLAEPRERT